VDYRCTRGWAATGVLFRFPPSVTQQALALKRAHPIWGPDRVLADLGRDQALGSLALPSRSRLAVLFKTTWSMKAICRILYDVLHNLRFPFVFQGSGIAKKSATETISKTLYNGELTAI